MPNSTLADDLAASARLLEAGVTDLAFWDDPDDERFVIVVFSIRELQGRTVKLMNLRAHEVADEVLHYTRQIQQQLTTQR